MKKFSVLLLLAAISLFGCRSRSSSYGPVTYKITGLGTVTVTPTQSGELALNFAKITTIATSETITLSLSGLPVGVTAAINPKTGTVPFTSSIVLTDSSAMAVAGTYTVNLMVHSSSSGDKSYSFTLTVSGGGNNNSCDISGLYSNSTAACAVNGSYDYVETVMNDSMTANKVIFKNFASYGYPVYGMVNCATNTITIPTQSLPNFLTVSGSGTFTSNDSVKAVSVSYTTMTQDSIMTSCQFSLIQ
jgi:hypothetical protein